MNSKATVGIPLDEYFCISIKPKTKASPGDAFWLRFRVSLSAVSCASHVTAGLIRFAGENMSFICRSWLLFCGWMTNVEWIWMCVDGRNGQRTGVVSCFKIVSIILVLLFTMSSNLSIRISLELFEYSMQIRSRHSCYQFSFSDSF